MKITLTYHEGRSLLRCLDEPLVTFAVDNRKNTWRQSHVYHLPAAGWRRILDNATARAYGPRGGKKYGASLYTGIAKVAKAVREWELHPAFRPDCGVVGIDTTVLPGFITHDGLRSPYPNEYAKFVLFCPQLHLDRGRQLTTWEPGSCASEHPLHSEEFHRIFATWPIEE